MEQIYILNPVTTRLIMKTVIDSRHQYGIFVKGRLFPREAYWAERIEEGQLQSPAR